MFSCGVDLLQKKGPGKLRKELILGFDPVSLLLHQLQDRFHESATFFVDSIGGHVIGIKWSARALEAAPFDVKKAHMLAPADFEGQDSAMKVQDCSLAVSALLADVKAVGSGLIHYVELSR